MITLIRYALLKAYREKTLAMIVLAPAVMIGSPLLGIGVIEMLRGHGGFPFSIEHGHNSRETLALTYLAGGLAVFAAAAAGFSLYRTEVARRMIGSLVLAVRTSTLALSAVFAGAFVGVLAFGVEVAVVLALTLSKAPELGTIALATVIACVLGAAGGILLCSISSEYGMLVPLYLVLIPATITVFTSTALIATALVIAASAACLARASFFLERRCAS